MKLFFLIGLTFIGGIAVALQARVMGNVENKLNVWSSVSINFIFGSLAILIFSVFFYLIDFFDKKNFNFNTWMNKALELKWWEYSSGIFGLIIVGIVGFSASRLGIVTTLTFFVIGQIFTAILLDHYGLFGGKVYPINFYKFLALAFFSLGIFFFLKS